MDWDNYIFLTSSNAGHFPSAVQTSHPKLNAKALAALWAWSPPISEPNYKRIGSL